MGRLTIENLSLRHIAAVSLTVEAAECVTISGASGAGKTLLMRAISDLEPHQGQVYLDGVECSRFRPPEWRRSVGLLPSESQWWRDTVGEHFKTRPAEWLEMLAFEPDVMTWPVSRLSSGERQRLAFLRLLGNQPRVLLLDEPTANLDPENIRRVERVLSLYRDAHRPACLWISHDADQIRRVSLRHFKLKSGTLQEQATV